MREPGASEVLMWGFTRRPFSTAFLASRPAASMTPGFEVFVQLVIAAISTSPLPIVMSCVSTTAGTDFACAAGGVGLFASISSRKRGASPATGGLSCGRRSSSSSTPGLATRWRVMRTSGDWLKPFSPMGLENRVRKVLATLPISMRSCGRLGPDRLGVTVPRSSFTTCE